VRGGDPSDQFGDAGGDLLPTGRFEVAGPADPVRTLEFIEPPTFLDTR